MAHRLQAIIRIRSKNLKMYYIENELCDIALLSKASLRHESLPLSSSVEYAN